MLKPPRRLERAVRGVAASIPAPSKEALTATPSRENGLSDSVCAEQTVKSVTTTRNRDAKTNGKRRGMRITPIPLDSGWLPGRSSTQNSVSEERSSHCCTESGRLLAREIVTTAATLLLVGLN